MRQGSAGGSRGGKGNSMQQSSDRLQFYIGGAWVDPIEMRPFHVIDPSTEEPLARIALGGVTDVDRAVQAARKAFETWSRTSVKERAELLRSIVAAYQKSYERIAETISKEMGAPIGFAKAAQAATGLGHLMQTIGIL